MHDLQVHQAELEQQNAELLRAYDDLAAARDRFADLFDFAPVSYLTLDRQGRIIEANLTAASEFRIERQGMLGRPFGGFIAPPDSDRWQRLVTTAFRGGDARRIDLTVLRQDGAPFRAQLDCRLVEHAASKAELHVSLTDVSLRQLAERNRRIATSVAIARDSERRGVAVKLHEDLGQRLGMLKMQLTALALPPECRAARSALGSMVADIDQALVLVRRMSTDLHPLMLDDLGLNTALEWLVDDIASRRGLRADLHIGDAEVPTDESLALAIYRLAEMALEHFARHVDAGLGIELLRRPRDVVLQFQSSPGHCRNPGFTGNLMDMTEAFRDQVHLLGGRLEASELPEGTRRLCVFIDLQPTRPPAASAVRVAR